MSVNTQSKKVNLTKRVEVEFTQKNEVKKELRYCPVVLSGNGKIRPDVVLVKGVEERHSEGAYYIEWRESGKHIRLSVGKSAQEALNAKKAKEAELSANNHGVVVVKTAGKNSLVEAISGYLEEIKLTKKPKTFAAYSTALAYFKESCHKQNVEDIDRRDMLKFSAFLRDAKEQAPRSVYNKFENVMAFLKAQGVQTQGIHGLVGKNDWPRFTEEETEVYEKGELNTFWAACNEEERLWFEFFLMTGMREQEVMYTYWSDVNLTTNVVKVTHKPDRDWTPKAYKEREIPIPAKLVDSLKTFKAKSDKGCNLLFPTAGCKPKLDFLDCLKRVVKRAGLNPDGFWLHKFRATFATWHLWNGNDLRTVQSWLGHSDLESTMRYLKPARGQEVHAKVNGTFA